MVMGWEDLAKSYEREPRGRATLHRASRKGTAFQLLRKKGTAPARWKLGEPAGSWGWS